MRTSFGSSVFHILYLHGIQPMNLIVGMFGSLRLFRCGAVLHQVGRYVIS